jgi:transcriptional regulator with XRE-family HTH domain
MNGTADRKELRRSRDAIARRVRDLRRSRRWTQSNLAKHLGLSQSRLSEIEAGDGSFSAEQFLLILRLFNVAAHDFGERREDPADELQKVLARFGAAHLRENDAVLPSERLEDLGAAVREALVVGTPRLVTAVAPALVRSGPINLKQVEIALASVGLDRRVGWACENTLSAVRAELPAISDPTWARRYRRAEVTLASFLASTRRASTKKLPPDVLDASVRSAASLRDVAAAASPISRRWGIVSGLRLADFIDALRSARAAS